MVSKSPRAAQSSHRTRLLILNAGSREPRMQISVVRSIARLMHAFKNPLTTEYGCTHFAVSRSAICLSRFLASHPIRPSMETTNANFPNFVSDSYCFTDLPLLKKQSQASRQIYRSYSTKYNNALWRLSA
jgi:hypothetical protein